MEEMEKRIGDAGERIEETEERIATACGLAMTESTDCHASLAMTDFAVQPIACHSEERSDVGIRVPEEQRVEQLKRLSGILIDRLEEAVEGKDFSVKEIRTYTNTLMDLRQIQMTDPELIAKEQQLRLIKLRREAGELAPRQLRICFEGEAERASE